MRRAAHTTKKGPGRRHVDGTYRNGFPRRHVDADGKELPREYPGAKLARKAMAETLTKRS